MAVRNNLKGQYSYLKWVFLLAGFNLTFISVVNAQNLPTLLFNDFTTSQVNPAFYSEKKLNVKVGETSLFVGLGGVKLNDLTNDQGIVSLQNNAAKLDASTPINLKLRYSTFDINYKFKGINIQLGHAWNASSNVKYSQGFVNLLSFGNAPYIGQEIPIEIRSNYNSYNELYIGFSKKIKSFGLGIRVKMLNGIDNIWTDKGDIGLFTSAQDFSITAKNDISIYSNGAFNADRIEDINLNFRNFGLQNLGVKNFGFASDLGLSFQINSKINLTAGINDLGFIKWQNGKNYSSQSTQKLNGVDLIDQLVNGSSFSFLDSIYNLVTLDHVNQDYIKAIDGYGFVGVNYKANEKYSFAVDANITSPFGNLTLSSLRFQGMRTFDKIRVGSSIAYQNNTLLNLGLFGQVKYKGISLYILTDNFLGIISPKNFSTFGARAGLTYVII